MLERPRHAEFNAELDWDIVEQLSVKQLEELVVKTNAPSSQREPVEPPKIDPNVRAAQTELERLLGLRVQIRDRKGRGKITIEYSTLEDFDRVVEMLSGARS